jgi:hypothetical protein
MSVNDCLRRDCSGLPCAVSVWCSGRGHLNLEVMCHYTTATRSPRVLAYGGKTQLHPCDDQPVTGSAGLGDWVPIIGGGTTTAGVWWGGRGSTWSNSISISINISDCVSGTNSNNTSNNSNSNSSNNSNQHAPGRSSVALL